MGTIIKRSGAVVVMSLGILMFGFEAKAQTQEKQDKTKMEKIEANTENLQLFVEGMSCQAGCANGIDNMLKQQNGILTTKTSFDLGTSEVRYDKDKISEKEIIDLIEDRGFKTKAKDDDEGHNKK